MNSKMCPEAVNCIGYVYHQLGLEEKEVFIDPPALHHLLEDFEIVSPETAVAIGILSVFDERYSNVGAITKTVTHMAKVDPDRPGWIYHRSDFGKPISHDPMCVMLRENLVDPSSAFARESGVATNVLYLALKEEKSTLV